jgi:hypothetical protein
MRCGGRAPLGHRTGSNPEQPCVTMNTLIGNAPDSQLNITTVPAALVLTCKAVVVVATNAQRSGSAGRSMTPPLRSAR